MSASQLSDFTPLRAPKWVGGKTCAPNGTGINILKRLPPAQPKSAYVEPYAGMCGVLLARQPVEVEMINDLNGAVAAFWRATRDHSAELTQRLAWTEYGREVLAEAEEILANPYQSNGERVDDVKLGWALVVQCQQSAMVRGQIWGRHKTDRSQWQYWRPDIERLAERLRLVQIENRDALEVIEWWSDQPQAVLYIDPPYQETSRYYDAKTSLQDLMEVLSRANLKCRVLLSGYESCPYDQLGWRSETFTTYTTYWHHTSGKSQQRERTEKVWMNYPLSNQAIQEPTLPL